MSTIWVLDEELGDKFVIRQAIYSEMKDQKSIIVRDATFADIPAILEAEEKIWEHKEHRATEEQFRSRINIFPDCTKIAVRDGKVLGIGCAMIMDYPWDDHYKTYGERTDNGLIRNHDPMGHTMSAYSVGKLPDAPENVARALFEAGLFTFIRLGIPYSIGSPRLPGYKKVKDTMTAEEYAKQTDENGRYIDPVLRWHQQQGFELIDVKPGYYGDEDSCDYSAIIKFDNPFLPYSWETRFNHQTGKSEEMLVFGIPIGCSWANSKDGGCTNCGFQRGINKSRIFMSYIDMVLNDFIGIFDRAVAHIGKASSVAFYTGGSFFEAPRYLIRALLRRVSAVGQISGLLIETRPEFVTEENLRLLKKNLRDDIVVKVAIGLESASDEIREKNINKGFSRDDYIKAVNLVQKNNLIPCTYVLLKPLGVNEKDAVDDAIETIKWSHSVGSRLTLLQSAFVQKGTPLAEAYKAGEYQPPKLWSVIKILSQLAEKYPIYLGRFEDYPPPIARPANCGKCDKAVNSILENYRQTNILEIDQIPSCDCQNQWLQEME